MLLFSLDENSVNILRDFAFPVHGQSPRYVAIVESQGKLKVQRPFVDRSTAYTEGKLIDVKWFFVIQGRYEGGKLSSCCETTGIGGQWKGYFVNSKEDMDQMKQDIWQAERGITRTYQGIYDYVPDSIGSSCSMLTSKSSEKIPENFGVPWNVFKPEVLLLDVYCSDEGVTVRVGWSGNNNVKLSPEAHITKDGKAWQKISLASSSSIFDYTGK